VRERIYTSAANRAGRISEGRTAAKAKWEADKSTEHYGYRLKGKAGSRRPVPMTSVKPLAARFYRLKSGHAPTGPYLKRLDTERTICAGGAEAEQCRRESIYSATAAGGKTSKKCSRRRWGRPQAGKRADADTCRFLSCFSWRNATKR